MALTAKQRRFVAEYLLDLNATQAAIRAGYSKNRASEIGYQLLQKPDITSAIQAAMKERAERTRPGRRLRRPAPGGDRSDGPPGHCQR